MPRSRSGSDRQPDHSADARKASCGSGISCSRIMFSNFSLKRGIESEEGRRKHIDQLYPRRPPFAGVARSFRPSCSRNRSSSNSTCLLRDRRSCFAISANRDLRLAGTRTSKATLGSVIARSKNSRIQQFSICNCLILCDTLCFRENHYGKAQL